MTKSDISSAGRKQRNAIKKACIENAKWLLMQARDNFHRQNFSLSAFLAITAYEESLKYGLLNSHASNMLTAKKYNEITSNHTLKLLSKHASIALYVVGKGVKQKYTLPKTDLYQKEAREIREKRERALYVDFNDLKINIPTSMNPADAMEEINRAYKSIESETASEQLGLLIKKRIKDIRKQKLIEPTPLSGD